jgi:hypothetical protein
MSSTNYREECITRLLRIVIETHKVKEKLPLGMNDWEAVHVAYTTRRPPKVPERDLESLRRKFKGDQCSLGMVNVKKPTGDPTIPPHVRDAKRIQHDINVKAGQVNLEQDAPNQTPSRRINASVNDPFIDALFGTEVSDTVLGDDDAVVSQIDEPPSMNINASSGTPVGSPLYAATPIGTAPNSTASSVSTTVNTTLVPRSSATSAK